MESQRVEETEQNDLPSANGMDSVVSGAGAAGGGGPSSTNKGPGKKRGKSSRVTSEERAAEDAAVQSTEVEATGARAQILDAGIPMRPPGHTMDGDSERYAAGNDRANIPTDIKGSHQPHSLRTTPPPHGKSPVSSVAAQKWGDPIGKCPVIVEVHGDSNLFEALETDFPVYQRGEEYLIDSVVAVQTIAETHTPLKARTGYIKFTGTNGANVTLGKSVELQDIDASAPRTGRLCYATAGTIPVFRFDPPNSGELRFKTSIDWSSGAPLEVHGTPLKGQSSKASGLSTPHKRAKASQHNQITQATLPPVPEQPVKPRDGFIDGETKEIEELAVGSNTRSINSDDQYPDGCPLPGTLFAEWLRDTFLGGCYPTVLKISDMASLWEKSAEMRRVDEGLARMKDPDTGKAWLVRGNKAGVAYYKIPAFAPLAAFDAIPKLVGTQFNNEDKSFEQLFGCKTTVLRTIRSSWDKFQALPSWFKRLSMEAEDDVDWRPDTRSQLKASIGRQTKAATFPGRKFRRETSQRLFVEHFLRRLIKAYGVTNTFFLSPSASSDEKVKQFIEFIGGRLGIFPWARSHTCSSCTREKQPQQQALDPAIAIDAVAEINDEVPVNAGHEPAVNEADVDIVERLREIGRAAGNIEEQEDEEKQYIRMAVMDGKTLHHRICAVRACRNPLVNYKNGRFCANHKDKQDECAFETCTAPVGEGRPVCLDPEHVLQYNQWTRRFGRISHRTITRYYHEGVNNSVIQIQNTDPPLPNENQEHVPNQERLSHTLRARRIYCIETCQWACGIPIGWGKMYEAESPTQVLQFLDTLWPPEAPEPRPSFIAYDNACKVLRHLGTHHLGGTWIRTTRFIVDAFHYITHTKKDVLCRTFCNPSPLNGSNPDLIKTIEIDGIIHKKRAFNTETAEQLNAWLSGYEVQLHGETLQKRTEEKEGGGILGLAEQVDGMVVDD